MKRVLMLAAALVASIAVQAEYPDKPIRLVVPFGAGTTIRLSVMSGSLGQAWFAECPPRG